MVGQVGASLSPEVINRALELQQQATAAQASVPADPVLTPAPAKRTWGQAAADTGLGLLQGAVGLGQAAYGVGNFATFGGLDALTGMSENFQQTNQILNDARSAPFQAQQATAQKAFDDQGIGAGLSAYIHSPALLGDALASNLPSLLPAAGYARFAAATAEASAVAQGLGAAATKKLVEHASEKAVLATTALQTGGQTNVDATNAIRDAGGSGVEQALGGMGAGLLAGAAGAAIGKVTGASKFQGAVANALPGGVRSALPTGGVVATALGGAGREATEEYFQSGSQQLAQNSVTPNTPIMQGVGQQAAVGGLIGGLLGGITGGAAGAVSPRNLPAVRSATPLRDLVGNLLGRANANAGGTLAPSPLADPLLHVENIDYAHVPSPDEHINMDSTPLPGQGEQTNIHVGDTPLPADHIDLGATPLPENTVDLGSTPVPADIGTLGSGTDLLGAPLPPQGAVPAPVTEPSAEAAAVAPDSQGQLPFVAPGTSWKSHLAKELGLKPQSLTGKGWSEFSAAAEAAGVSPSDPGAEAFLAHVAPQLAANPATAKGFAAALATKYAPQVPSPDPLAPVAPAQRAPSTLEPTNSMSRTASWAIRDKSTGAVVMETYDPAKVAALNTTKYEAVPIADHLASLSGTELTPRGKKVAEKAAKQLAVVNATPTVQTPAVADWLSRQLKSVRDYYKVPEGVDLQDTIDRNLGSENQSRAFRASNLNSALQSIKTKLSGIDAWRQANPDSWATAVGDGVRLSGEDPVTDLGIAAGHIDPNEVRIVRDAATAASVAALAAPVTPQASIADPVTRQAAVLNSALSAPVDQTPTTPGSPGGADIAQPIGIDQHIAKHRSLDPTATAGEAAAAAFSDLLGDANAPDMLDQTFLAIKAHPSWESLTAPQKVDVAEEFSTRYARVEGGNPGKFQRGSAVAEPINVHTFATLVATANQKANQNSSPIVPLETVSDYEALTGQAAPPDARGIFAEGKIYLIRQNLATPKDLVITLAHEQGHQGLSALLGDRLTPVTNLLWTNAAIRPQIREKMQAQGLSRSVAAEEVLADMLAGGQKVNGDVLSKVRNAIETGMAKLIGINDMRMDNAEVDALLRDVARVNRGLAPSAVSKDAPHLRGLIDAMADPQQAMAGDVRFSRALGDLDTIISQASSEGGAPRRSLNDVTKDAATASVGYVKGVFEAFKTGGAFGALLNAMPLNQIESLYHKSLPGLTEFVRLKDRKEATTNTILTKTETLDYRQGAETFDVSTVDLGREWEKFKRTAPSKAKALDNLHQYSTLYRLHPDEPSFENQSKVNYAEQHFTEEERQQAHEQVRKLYKSVGEEGRTLFKKAQASYSSTWNKRFTELQKMLVRTTGHPVGSREFEQAFGNNINSALAKLKDGAYSPLQRYGDYLVTVRDAEGNQLSFEGFDTKSQADARVSELATDPDAANLRVNQSARINHDWQRDGINAKTISDLEAVADGILPGDDNVNLRKEVREALVEAYLSSLPQQSFLTNANKRKGIAGFTTDTLRAYSDYSMKAARSISSLQFDDQINRQLRDMQVGVSKAAETGTPADTTKTQRVLEAAKAQHAASQDFSRSPTADLLTQGGFVFFMTSPSQFFINSMQTAMVTLPRLAGTYGSGPALRSIKAAMGALVKSRGDLLGGKSSLDVNSNDFRVLEELRVRGDLNATYAHDVAGLARGDAGAMSGHWRTAMEVTGYAMHKSEQLNRQIVALATARLELEARTASGTTGPLTAEELASMADTAKQAVDSTQFNYAKYNKPTVMQGPWRKAIFQFQQYRLNMLAMIAKDIRDGFVAKDATPAEKLTARRALAWQLGTQLTLTGAAGTVLAPLVFGIMDLFRDDDDLLDSRTEFLRAYPQWLTHGVLSGAIDLERTGADSLIPLLGDRKYAPQNAKPGETFNYYVMQNIGPWAGLLGGAYTGATKLMQGDVLGATKGLMPAPIRDFYKATYEAGNGARDARQITYYEPGVWDTVLGAMGLRSGDRKEAEEIRGSSFQASSTAQTLRQRYLGQLAIGHALGDQGQADEARASIQAFNAKYPDLGIKGSDIKRAVVNRVRAQNTADQYGIASSKLPQSILTAVGK